MASSRVSLLMFFSFSSTSIASNSSLFMFILLSMCPTCEITSFYGRSGLPAIPLKIEGQTDQGDVRPVEYHLASILHIQRHRLRIICA